MFIPRAGWGARPPRSVSRNVDSKGFAIHYSGADADEQSNHANCAGRVKNIQNFHMDGRKWTDIAYSFLICKHGVVFEGRGYGIRTAANGTNAGNQSDLAICFLGDDTKDRDDITDAGRQGLREFIVRSRELGKVGNGLRGHRDWKATACPGDELYGWLKAGMPLSQGDDMPLSAEDKKAIREIVKDEIAAVRASITDGNAGGVFAYVAATGKTAGEIKEQVDKLVDQSTVEGTLKGELTVDLRRP